MYQRTRVLAAACAVALLAGCGGPATFVSLDPPPATTADAWFAAGAPAVRDALLLALTSEGFSLDSGGPKTLVATKHAVPYIDEETAAPVSGPLPVYVLEGTVARPNQTHVRLVLSVRHQGTRDAPFEWEYPTDVLRAVLDRTRDALREPRARYHLPPRFRAPRWRRPSRPRY